MICPNCRRHTFSKKWETCTACHYRHLGQIKTETVTPKPETVTLNKGGRGKRSFKSNAERQRAYRERQRMEQDIVGR